MERGDNHAGPQRVDAAIIGSGFSGLCMAIQLKKAGFERVVILEKAHEVGGTWRENTYPGAACDVQSHLYSLSFAPNPSWSRVYSGWQEIQRYLVNVSHEYGLRQHIRFGAQVVAADYDESAQCWDIRLAGGESIVAKTLIIGTGPLHVPQLPNIKGLDRFAGPVFHSAQWRHDVELNGKRVASIGTGGSAIQYVPEVAKKAAHLTVFQRSAAWVLPRNERAYTGFEKACFKYMPGWRRLYRSWLYWLNESRILPFRHPFFIRSFQWLALWNLRRSVKDRTLRKKLTPDYTIGCKRILISNQYYAAFNRPNVHLETDGIVEVREHGVVTRDATGVEQEHEVDALILGTGFVTDPLKYMKDMPIRGVGGQKLLEAWSENAEAYLGMTVTGFPNLFMMVGPNTGLGHNSVIFMIEAQAKYIVKTLSVLRGRNGGELDGAVEVKAETQRAFNEQVQKDLQGTVWQTGCHSWYLQENGNNFTVWPGSTASYFLKTLSVNQQDYNWSDATANVTVKDAQGNGLNI